MAVSLLSEAFREGRSTESPDGGTMTRIALANIRGPAAGAGAAFEDLRYCCSLSLYGGEGVIIIMRGRSGMTADMGGGDLTINYRQNIVLYFQVAYPKIRCCGS